MMPLRQDVVVIGAGHNGLVAAAYLARAGLRTLVLERRPVVGGCVVTEEIFPGFRINTASYDHVQINWTPILEELDLARYGLEYLEPDPAFMLIFPGGRSISIYRDVERTAESIGRFSPRDAGAYLSFHRFARELTTLLRPGYLAAPDPWSLVRHTAPTVLRRAGQLLRCSWIGDLLRVATSSCRDLVQRLFETPEPGMTLAMSVMSSGVSPSAPGTAFLTVFHDLVHQTGVKRPRGGSGLLAQALRRKVEHAGGTIETGCTVSGIVTERGRVKAVRLEDGTTVESGLVLSAIEPRATLLRLLGETDLPQRFRSRAQSIRVANGVCFKVDCAIRELPDYELESGADARASALPTQFILPSLDHAEAAYREYSAGRVPREPPLMVATHSALDPSLAPPGRHTLTLETRFAPYQLGDASRWADLREAEAERLLGLLGRYAHNIPSVVEARFIQSPEDLEERFAIPRGHLMHCDMSPDQMVMRRPFFGCASYRTPIRGLYLTGAGTHPGGGVSGAPGRNAARVVLQDLGLAPGG